MHPISEVVKLKTHDADDGSLCVISLAKEVPFEVKRIFYVTNVPKHIIRGEHAHYKTQQFLICIRGKIMVELYLDKNNTQLLTLYPNEGVFIPAMIWDSQAFLTGDDVLLVLASTEYNRNDYIEDKNIFNQVKKFV